MFRKEQLSESPRENFIGVIVWAEFPCECPICKKGMEKINGRGRELKKVHIVIKPLHKYSRLQHAWYPESKTIWSALGGFVIALNDLLGFVPEGNSPEEQWKQVKQYLLGNRAFEFTSEVPVEFVSKVLQKEIPANIPENARKAREQWFPIHEYSEEDIQQMFNVSIEEVREQGKQELQELFTRLEQEEEQLREMEEMMGNF